MGSVLTLSCPLGSPTMVGSAPSSPVYEPVGGWLADFVQQLLHATDNAYILQTVSEGIRLEFLERPPLVESPMCGRVVGSQESWAPYHAQALGFLVTWAKLELVPTQMFVFLRDAYDLVAGLVRPSEEAVAKVQSLCRILRRQSLQTARFLLWLLGVFAQ